MHVKQKKSTIDMLTRYSQGEHITHKVMRIVASDILEMHMELTEEVKELETDYHAKKKEMIREKFLADPKNSFALAYKLVLDAADKNPEDIQIIGEVAQEFGIDISDCEIK